MNIDDFRCGVARPYGRRKESRDRIVGKFAHMRQSEIISSDNKQCCLFVCPSCHVVTPILSRFGSRGEAESRRGKGC
jgi:hypothetical protein